MSLRKLYYFLPPSARILARRLYFLPHDLIQKISGNDKLKPPEGMIYTGGGDFIETGNRFKDYFIKHGGLLPSDHVLDIGSGIGRLAIPLTDYISADGLYHGYDLISQGVDWCKNNISTLFPNFQFHQIKLHNDLYNKDGLDATTYTFPLESSSQDFVFLISVFTHLIPEEMAHYISEISRMLKPGKTCFATFFIHDDQLLESNDAFSFKHRKEIYSLMDPKVVSANVAFKKDYLFQVFKDNGLQIEHYFPGYWRDTAMQDKSLDFQDIVILRKD